MRMVNIYKCGTDGSRVLLSKVPIQYHKKAPWRPDRFVAQAIEVQKQEDILGLGYTAEIKDLGVKRVFRAGDGILQTWDPETGKTSSSPVQFTNRTGNPGNITLDMEFYRQGYVVRLQRGNETYWLSTKQAANPDVIILPVSKDKGKANTWVTLKYLLVWCETHQGQINYLKQNGWHLTYEACSQLAHQEEIGKYRRMRPGVYKGKEKDMARLSDIFSLSEEPQEALPAGSEAANRMGLLGLRREITGAYLDYGKVLVSDLGGLVSIPDSQMESILTSLSEAGRQPYHIIRDKFGNGNGVTLYVLSIAEDDGVWRITPDKFPVWSFGTYIGQKKISVYQINGVLRCREEYPAFWQNR